MCTRFPSFVEIGRYGAIHVDPEQLVRTKEVQEQIATLSKLIENGVIVLRR